MQTVLNKQQAETNKHFTSLLALFKYQGVRTTTTLVPRPSHRPVFDNLQYAKNGGGRPGIFYHVNDISVYLGTQRGGGVIHRKNKLEASLRRA